MQRKQIHWEGYLTSEEEGLHTAKTRSRGPNMRKRIENPERLMNEPTTDGEMLLRSLGWHSDIRRHARPCTNSSRRMEGALNKHQ